MIFSWIASVEVVGVALLGWGNIIICEELYSTNENFSNEQPIHFFEDRKYRGVLEVSTNLVLYTVIVSTGVGQQGLTLRSIRHT